MKKKYVKFVAVAFVAGTFLMSCSSTTENTGSNYSGADGTQKTISDGGNVPVEGTTEQSPEHIDHTRDANPPGDSVVAPGDTTR